YEPNKANTLFNLGIVKWQSKNDAAGAIAVWQKLLDTNPNYEARDKVRQMIDQAECGSRAPSSEEGWKVAMTSHRLLAGAILSLCVAPCSVQAQGSAKARFM